MKSPAIGNVFWPPHNLGRFTSGLQLQSNHSARALGATGSYPSNIQKETPFPSPWHKVDYSKPGLCLYCCSTPTSPWRPLIPDLGCCLPWVSPFFLKVWNLLHTGGKPSRLSYLCPLLRKFHRIFVPPLPRGPTREAGIGAYSWLGPLCPGLSCYSEGFRQTSGELPTALLWLSAKPRSSEPAHSGPSYHLHHNSTLKQRIWFSLFMLHSTPQKHLTSIFGYS